MDGDFKAVCDAVLGRWRASAETITEVAERFGVSRVALANGIAWILGTRNLVNRVQHEHNLCGSSAPRPLSNPLKSRTGTESPRWDSNMLVTEPGDTEGLQRAGVSI